MNSLLEIHEEQEEQKRESDMEQRSKRDVKKTHY